MTELHEKRWKCDWCGNVSPVLDGRAPMGWVFVSKPLPEVQGKVIQTNGAIAVLVDPEPQIGEFYHFCTAAHRDDFLADRQRSGETELME